MTSVLNVDTIADKAGTGPVALTKQEATKIHAQINQDSTQAVIGSFGVSSISDLSTGRTTVSHTNSFSDATYTSVASAAKDFDDSPSNSQAEMAACVYTETSQSHYNANNDAGSSEDGQLFFCIFGDLA